MCFLPTIVFFIDNAKHLPTIVKTLQTSHSHFLLNMCYIIFNTKTVPFHKKCTNQIDCYNIISSLPQYFLVYNNCSYKTMSNWYHWFQLLHKKNIHLRLSISFVPPIPINKHHPWWIVNLPKYCHVYYIHNLPFNSMILSSCF